METDRQNEKNINKPSLGKSIFDKISDRTKRSGLNSVKTPSRDDRAELLKLIRSGDLTTDDVFRELQQREKDQLVREALLRVKTSGTINHPLYKENNFKIRDLNKLSDTLKMNKKSIQSNQILSSFLSSAPNSPVNSDIEENILLENKYEDDDAYSSINDCTVVMQETKIPIKPPENRQRSRSYKMLKKKRTVKPKSKLFCFPIRESIESSIYSDLSQSVPNSPIESEDEEILNPFLIYANTFSTNPGTMFDSDRNETKRLLEILEKLNLQNHWKSLVDSGVKSIKDLSQLTRVQLVRIGIDDVEDRASLLTAAQLLSDDRLLNILSYDHKRLNSSNNSSDSNYNMDNGTLSSGSSPYKIDSGYNTESSPNIQTLLPSVANQNSNNLTARMKNLIINTDTKNMKPPTGILRNFDKTKSPASVNPATINSRESSVQKTPAQGRVNKSVKIDESSLPKQVDYKQKMAENLKLILKDKLCEEKIRLENPPYSDQDGNYGIPLPLVQRYSIELGLETERIAISLDEIRISKLKEINRNYVSNEGEIKSRIYLNCPFIKTNTIRDLLISIGLPMYADNFNHENLRPQDLKKFDSKFLIRKFNMTKFHADWLYRQMRMIPTVLWNTNGYRKRSATLKR